MKNIKEKSVCQYINIVNIFVKFITDLVNLSWLIHCSKLNKSFVNVLRNNFIFLNLEFFKSVFNLELSERSCNFEIKDYEQEFSCSVFFTCIKRNSIHII